ncbi:hypothetical protein [Corallococcus sp. EGB]|uniref:hypothetical protein n=1 Tax=Corallococcus sp. EGB TaxID=1521117 RepID=UPI001CBCB30A|nr:hypothetical protein [Corallococcus sp. EGB]
MRATKPHRGLGWMAGAVGLLVTGRFLRRRAGAAHTESAPEAVSALEPVDWALAAAEAPSALPLEEAGASAREDLTHEDMAPWEDDELEGAGPGGPPRIRRGPSGREHYWLEP